MGLQAQAPEEMGEENNAAQGGEEGGGYEQGRATPEQSIKADGGDRVPSLLGSPLMFMVHHISTSRTAALPRTDSTSVCASTLVPMPHIASGVESSPTPVPLLPTDTSMVPLVTTA